MIRMTGQTALTGCYASEGSTDGPGSDPGTAAAGSSAVDVVARAPLETMTPVVTELPARPLAPPPWP